MTHWPLLLVLPLAVVFETVGAGGARAQSLVDQRPEDPREAARALDIADTTPGAENVRRACRLERFQDRLAAERIQQGATQELARDARIQQWIDATQPSRVTHPLAFEGFFGSGLASYGVSFSWDFLRHAELGVWLGWRPIPPVWMQTGARPLPADARLTGCADDGICSIVTSPRTSPPGSPS